MPIDRQLSVVEVWAAGRTDALEAMTRRLATGYYAKIYVIGEMLGPQVDKSRYVVVEEIPSPARPESWHVLDVYASAGQRFVFQMARVRIYRATEASGHEMP